MTKKLPMLVKITAGCVIVLDTGVMLDAPVASEFVAVAQFLWTIKISGPELVLLQRHCDACKSFKGKLIFAPNQQGEILFVDAAKFVYGSTEWNFSQNVLFCYR